MDWKINIVSALLLTSLTGGVAMIFWWAVERRMEQWGYHMLLAGLLRGIIGIFFVPILWLTMWLLDYKMGVFGGKLFLQTPELAWTSGVLLVIWLFVTCLIIAVDVTAAVATYRQFQKRLPTTVQQQNIFGAVCEELGLNTGRVSLAASYRTETPFLLGVRKTCVLLPMVDYTEQELRVIFIHELTHYERRDLVFKWLAMAICAIHWFNPFAWGLARTLEQWSEYACDQISYERVGSLKEYCAVLAGLAESVEERRRNFGAALIEKKGALVKRVEQMLRQYQVSQVSIKRVRAFGVAVLLAGMVSVTALAAGTNAGYGALYEGTRVLISLDAKSADASSLKAKAGLAIEENGQVHREFLGDWYVFSWEVPRWSTVGSSPFFANEGDVVVVTGESDAFEWMIGIVDESGFCRYVQGSGTLYAEIPIRESRAYRIVVEQKGVRASTIQGSYFIR